MIEFLKKHISLEESREAKVNKLREVLQLLTLKIMQDKKCFSKMAFVGGTALRVLYNMRRFSEDLDFSVIDKKGYDFLEIMSLLRREFELNGLKIETKAKNVKAVQSCMLRFPELLNTLDVSKSRDQKLSIKIEADSNPPAGWHIEKTLVNKMYVLNITHFDLPSLYATKIHACFFRTYIKGRDFYDLMWYLAKKIKPYYSLLNNAIKQTQGSDLGLNDKNIKDFLLGRVAKVDFKTVKKDVERFLEDKSELKLLEAPIISKSIIDVFG